MTNTEKKLIDIIEVLCDCITDTPCCCDICPYGDYEGEQCKVYDLIEKIKAGGIDEE